ncbi:glycosyltransferase [bacterium]|nr:glycosyltransferase [bacterium]
MYEPQVSIVIPTYNIVENSQVNDFDLLLTLLGKQTYPYVEIIVMDNASNDGTVELLKEYKNDGVITFFSAPDQGKFDAINSGLMRAKGKYVSFLSCDDFYHDIMGIEKAVSLMEEEESDFCCFPSYFCSSDNVIVFEPAILNVFQVVPCPRQAMFFKKSALQELGYFDSKFKLLADYDLTIRLMLNGYAGVILADNIVTVKAPVQTEKHTIQSNAELSHIFHKNYRSMYPMTDEVLDRMVNISEVPQELLEKFADFFPDESRDEFFEQYESMYNFRVQNR